MTRLLILTLLLAPLTAVAGAPGAQIYRTTDEQGNVVFTDTPPVLGASAERVEIQPTNTAPPPKILPSPAASATAGEANNAAISYSVAITSPANETSFPMGPGNFSVSATVEPSLKNDASLQLYLDGTPWGEPQKGASWALTNVFRGQHDLTVGVTNADGQQLANSSPVRVFVHRPSANFRNR